jgi:hypothetical protein
MKDNRTRWILALVVWLGMAVLACRCTGPDVTQVTHPTEPPPIAKRPAEATAKLPEDIATEFVNAGTEADTPPSSQGVLDDLPEELLLAVLRPSPIFPRAPVELPAVEVERQTSDCYCLRLWGFPFAEVVHIELYDPSGQFIAAHEEALERGRPDRGLKMIYLFLGGRPAGDWVVVVDSAGVSVRTPLHVGEPAQPRISIALQGAGPFIEWYECPGGTYAPGDQIVLFGDGFPPARTLPLGIYEWRGDVEARHVYSLVYRQEVRTDDHGHFEVHEVVRALVLEGGGSYLATVALDPLASDDVGPSADFSVKSGISAPSEAVILELAVDGGAFVDPRVQQAVLAAVNRSHLSERFRGAPVTFLFSFRGNVIDTSGEPWDPDLARRLLAEAGYGNGVPVEFMYPDGDVELAVVAQDVGRDLVQLGISVELVPVSPADMIDRFGVQATAGMPVLLLIRR